MAGYTNLNSRLARLDYAKMAKDDPDLVDQFRLPGCNECHGGTGGGGFCPALSQGRLALGQYRRCAVQAHNRRLGGTGEGGFHALPIRHGARGNAADGADHSDIAFIRSINPPGANPPEKVIPGKYTAPEKKSP
jgi:hypothetical protein